MRVQEEIKLEIKKGFEVIVNHDGINPYEEWKKESKDALVEYLQARGSQLNAQTIDIN